MTDDNELHRRDLLKLGVAGAASLLAPRVGGWSADMPPAAPSAHPVPQGKLVLVGGSVIPKKFDSSKYEGFDKEDPHRILRRLPSLAGLPGEDFAGKTVVLVTSASGSYAKRNADTYRKKFEQLGARVLTVTNADEAENTDIAKAMADPDTAGVWFDGGDQLNVEDKFHYKAGSLSFQMDNLCRAMASEDFTLVQKEKLCRDIMEMPGFTHLALTPEDFASKRVALEEAVRMKYMNESGDKVRAFIRDVCEKIKDENPFYVYRRQKYKHGENAPTEAFLAMEKRFLKDANFFVAGTSAGAAVMPHQMLYNDRVEQGGFGLTKYFGGLLVDTHVDEYHSGRTIDGIYHTSEVDPLRGTVRLRQAMGKDRKGVGVALDGSAGIILDGGTQTMEVFGEKGKKVEFAFGGVNSPGEETKVVRVGDEPVLLAKLGLATEVVASAVGR